MTTASSSGLMPMTNGSAPRLLKVLPLPPEIARLVKLSKSGMSLKQSKGPICNGWPCPVGLQLVNKRQIIQESLFPSPASNELKLHAKTGIG